MGSEAWRSTRDLGPSIGFCSWLCPISECDRSSDGDPALEFVAVSLATGSTILVHRRRSALAAESFSGLVTNRRSAKTYQTLLGLIAVSGLRISEALSLRLSDVDLQDGVLTVRGTKFGKWRLVPLHCSVQRVLSKYKSRRDEYLNGRPASDFFFVTKRGTPLDKNNVRRTFHALSRQTGLRGEFDSHGPRLHDFRQHAESWIMPNLAE